MTVSAALYSLLTGDAATAALVVDRIYPKAAPQGVTRPYVVYHKTTRRPQRTLDGFSLTRGIWQIDAWSNTFDEAEAIHDAIEAVLKNFQGDAGGITLATSLDNSFDDFEPDTTLYRQSLDIIVWDCGPATT